MRRTAAVAGVVVAFAVTPAFAQPAQPAPPAPPAAGGGSSSWRAAVSAALAFGYAEGEMARLKRFSITATPRTKQALDAALEDLDQHAQRARDAYLFVERYGSTFWTVATKIRIGDTFWCQAEKISDIPVPLRLASPRLPPKILAQYKEVLHGLANPLRQQAHRSWERAVVGDASPFWSARARERLAGTFTPDC